MAKIEWHAGELFPRVEFVVTNLTKQSKNVVKFFDSRGSGRAMDQGRQERYQVDEALLPHVREQIEI